MRDSLCEAIKNRKKQVFASERRPGLVLRYGIAAAVVVVLVGVPLVRRQWLEAQSTIAANAVPRADHVVLSQPMDEPPRISDPDDEAEVPAKQLAEADPVAHPRDDRIRT